MEGFADAYALVGFLGTVVAAAAAAIFAGWRTARWLLKQFTTLIDTRVGSLETKLDANALALAAFEVVQNQHGERLAWLEGQAGQPLGSISRERTHQ